MGASVYPNLSNSIQSASGLKALKPAFNGRYLVNVQIFTLLFTVTVHKYMYPSVIICMRIQKVWKRGWGGGSKPENPDINPEETNEETITLCFIHICEIDATSLPWVPIVFRALHVASDGSCVVRGPLSLPQQVVGSYGHDLSNQHTGMSTKGNITVTQ